MQSCHTYCKNIHFGIEIRIFSFGYFLFQMRLLLIVLLSTLAVHGAQSASEKCYDKVEECHTTNYQDYVNCVRKRQKRSLDCDSPCDSDNCIGTCNECDCSSCGYISCHGSCDSCCSTCCNNYNVCTNNHCCHKTCHAQCRSSSCRSTCRKNCYERIKNMDEKSVVNNTVHNDNRHNITTIIHLNNIINNTNIVDIPISLNNTNQHNITLYERGEGGHNTESCCIVISPRQCVPQNEYPYFRCFHYRSKQCGAYCTAPIVHKEQQQICETNVPGGASNCRQSVIYVPQPQPRCTYQSVWPYVACGIPKPPSCAGCYSHYVDSNSQNYRSCPYGCYDEGFGIGPYYRQGPFYRPTYTHAPCYSCFGYGMPYGGFPAFGGYPSYGGYPGYGTFGGYPPALSNFGDPGIVSYGSWTPEMVNTFQQGNNNSDLPIVPLVDTFGTDPYRVARELEIDVDEPKSDAVQAEVKIRNPVTPLEKESDKADLNNTTQSSLSTKLS